MSNTIEFKVHCDTRQSGTGKIINHKLVLKEKLVRSYDITSTENDFIIGIDRRRNNTIRLKKFNDSYYYPSDEYGNFYDGKFDFATYPEYAIIYKNHVVILNHRCGSTSIRGCWQYATNQIDKNYLYDKPNHLAWGLRHSTVSDILNLPNRDNYEYHICMFDDPEQCMIKKLRFVFMWSCRDFDSELLKRGILSYQLSNMDQLHNEHCNFHYIPASTYLRAGNIPMDKIKFYKLSNINRLVYDVFGIEKCPALNKRENFQRSDALVTSKLVNDDQRKKMYEIFQCDFDLMEERKSQVI